MRKILKMFDDGSVTVIGLKGRGKDMLMGNVVARRKLPYVSNTNYGGAWIPFNPQDFNCGGNTYKDFIAGKLKHYDQPYPDNTDIYIGDAGVYFPAQYCNELNRDYGYLSTFMALSRHLGCRVHVNCQNLNRIYDKIREHSDTYICANRCRVLFHGQLVIQTVTIYEKYQSAVDRVPPFWLPRPLINPYRLQTWQIQKQNYQIAHGKIIRRTLIYRNLANYNTRVFKEMLANA